MWVNVSVFDPPTTDGNGDKNLKVCSLKLSENEQGMPVTVPHIWARGV